MTTSKSSFPGYDILSDLYYTQNISTRKLAAQFQVSPTTIRRWLIKSNIQIRSIGRPPHLIASCELGEKLRLYQEKGDVDMQTKQPQKPTPINDADKWYLRCDPAKMAENYCKAAEATLTREGIIDAGEIQEQSATLQVGARIGGVSRRSEGKTWRIIGVMGPYLIIRIKNNGNTNTRLISTDAYRRCDCYPSTIPVFACPPTTPIIDADAKQIATVESRRTTQPEIIVTREMA